LSKSYELLYNHAQIDYKKSVGVRRFVLSKTEELLKLLTKIPWFLKTSDAMRIGVS